MSDERKRDEIYLMNGIAYLEADLRISHLRILTAIIKSLQDAIRRTISKKSKESINQAMPPGGTIKGVGPARKIVLKTADLHIENNTYYVRKCLNEMRAIHCKFSDGAEFFGLIIGFRFPKYGRQVEIFLQESFVQHLLKDSEGYFYFAESVANNISNKYTMRIYWLVCSWRNKGGFVISTDALRNLLSVSKSYSRTDNLELKVIRPAREQLKEESKLWFLYKKYNRDGRELMAFKIKHHISQEAAALAREQFFDYAIDTLHRFGLQVDDIESILDKLDADDFALFAQKTAEIKDYILTHPTIRNRRAYILSALSNWYDNWLDLYEEL